MVYDKKYSVVHEWLRRFNLHEVEGLLELYVEKPAHTSMDIKKAHPKTYGTIYGRTPLSQWWYRCFECDPNLRYEMDLYLSSGGDTAVLVYFEGVGGGNPPAHRMITFTFEGLLIKSTKTEDVDDHSSHIRGAINPRAN